MIKKFVVCVIAIFLSSYSFKVQAQKNSYSDFFKEGSYLMLEENYDLALRNFLDAYNLDSTSANINFNVGYCYLKSATKKTLAERHLAIAVSNISKSYRQDDASEKAAPPTAHFLYGKALHLNYKFDEAIAQYDIFEKNYVGKDKEYKEETIYYKQQSVYAKELVAAPINVKIENLGDSINSEYPDFSPVLSADETMIVYTTRRNTSTGGEKTLDGQYYEDIVVAYKDENGKWSSPKSIGTAINTNGNDAVINLTPDGQTLITYQDVGKGGDVYFSTWDGKEWTALQEFGSNINSKYWETHACLSADNNTLYFVSDRPGGLGGRDIYRCRRLPNGKWSLAQNLGPKINTKYDDDGPFIHPDGVTLLFASKGHKSMGGFDILFSTIDEDQKFSDPVNMGYPINTPDDDVFFVTSPDGKRGYFSSDKDGGHGEKDIYSMYIPDAKEKPVALFKGLIVPAEGERLPEDLEIIVTNKETGEVVGKYKPKSNGAFSTILPPNKNYTFSYQSKGEEFYNEDLFVSNDVTYQEIKKEIGLEPVNLLGKVKVKDKKVILNAIVFNNSKEKIVVPNAKITLMEKGAADSNFESDATGKKDGIPLNFDKSYIVIAESNGKKSAPYTFNTNGIKGSKSITQILYLSGKPEKHKDNSSKDKVTDTDTDTDTDNSDNNKDHVKNAKGGAITCSSQFRYMHYFSYDKNETNEKTDWKNALIGLAKKTEICDEVTITIWSSASQVPSRAFASNRELAQSRAEKLQEKITAAVTSNGGNASKLKFIIHPSVRGPSYEGDHENREKYAKFQYVKALIK